ncbi:MAG TPA: S8 family peptidase, partial [Candidatus Angelobacter sp.]|nr:S8 family peptidase [Candidatus Angelobacter sp.]
LATFPSHRDGSVDVIIQFRQTPQARHFEALAARGGHLKVSLQHIKGAAYRIPAGMLAWLEKHPDVAYVSPDRPNKAAFDDAAPAVLGDLARQQYAVDGTGIGVAVIDSGVYNHDDLQLPFSATSRIVYSESFVPGDPSTDDAYGHGTHVAGIIAGNGQDSQTGYSEQYIGLAPNANIINLRVLDGNGVGSDSQVIAAIQRAIQLKNTYNIRIINLSLGRHVYESYTVDPLCQAVEAAWQAGIVVVVAAGNSGRDNTQGTDGYGTIQAPGNDPNVITVGATKTNGTPTRLDDTIASYSSKGPTLIDHVVKPDLVAPGNRIVSLQAPGSYLPTHFPFLDVVSPGTCITGICTGGTSSQYLRLSGTSMATPVVAGAAALMLQNDPTLTPDTIKARMMKTAWKGYPTSSWGYDFWGFGYLSQDDVFTIGAGYLDVDAALSTTDLVNGGAPSPTAVFDPVTGQARLTNSLSVVWGTSVIWGNSVVWGDSIVWSPGLVDDSIIWGNSVVWGQTSLAGNSIIWSTSIVWGPDSLDAMSEGEDGEN